MGENLGLVVERQTFDRSPLIVCNPEGQIRLWGRGMERLSGYRRDDAVGKRLDELLDVTYPGGAPDPGELQRRGRWSGKLSLVRRDGARVTVTAERLVLRSDDGAPDGSPAFDVVIIRAGRAEELSTLASIVNSSDDAIIGKTPQGVVTSWNRGAELMFGYTADEMIGQTLEQLFRPGTFVEEAEILARLRRGEHIDHYETTRLRKDGATIDVSISVSPVRDNSGQVIGASKIARDITEQKAVRARLDELQSQLNHVSRLNDMGQMAAGLAHELNQPLSAISNYISGAQKLIERGELDRAIEGCQRAAAQVVRAGEVIRRLRDFVEKAEAQKRLETLDQVIEESRALALLGGRGDGVRVETDIAPDAAEALMDKIQIQQVMVNLIRNAAEAMEASSVKRLRLSSRRPSPEQVEVSIADTGPGLSDQIKAKLFQPFSTTKQAGMGVGLSLCRSIVEAHGGRIWAEANEDGGVTFRFILPSA